MCVYTENALYRGVHTMYIGVYKGVFTVYTGVVCPRFYGERSRPKTLG